MNILHVVHNYYPAIGGVEWLMKNLSEGLIKRGHSVHAISSNATSCESYVFNDLVHPLLKPGEEMINGVKVSRVPFIGGGSFLVKILRILGTLFWRLRLPFHGFIRVLWQGPLSLKIFLKVLKAPCDIMVTSPLPTLNVLYAYLGAKIRKKPLVIIPCFHVEDRWAFDRRLYYWMLRGSDRVITLTEYEKRFLVSKSAKEERIDVRGVGILTNGYQVTKDYRKEYGIGQSPVVLFVGQLVAHKGIKNLIQAMQIVWQEAKDSFLVIAGSPTLYYSHLQLVINELPQCFREKTILIRNFAEEEKTSLFNMATVFVSVSKFESFGIVYLEAWHCRKPVIGCLQGASSTLIEDGKDGLLVRFDKPKELATAIKELLYDQDLRSRFGENGYQKLTKYYSWDNLISGYEESYLKAIQSHGRKVLQE